MSRRLLERRETGGGNRGLFLWYCPLGRSGLILPHIQETQIQGAPVEKWGWDWVDWGLPCSPGLASSWSDNLQKSRVLETIPPSLQSCPLLATPLTRALRLTYLSSAEVVCPWSAHLPDGNKRGPQTAPPGPQVMGISLSAIFTVWALAPPNCSWVHCQDGEGVGL